MSRVIKSKEQKQAEYKDKQKAQVKASVKAFHKKETKRLQLVSWNHAEQQKLDAQIAAEQASIPERIKLKALRKKEADERFKKQVEELKAKAKAKAKADRMGGTTT